jgi:hypothetical protein
VDDTIFLLFVFDVIKLWMTIVMVFFFFFFVQTYIRLRGHTISDFN